VNIIIVIDCGYTAKPLRL